MKAGFWGPEALPCLGRQGGVKRNNDSYNTKGVIHIKGTTKLRVTILRRGNVNRSIWPNQGAPSIRFKQWQLWARKTVHKKQFQGFFSCLDTFDSVGLVVAGFAILMMGRRAGGLAEPLLRFDSHVQVLLLRSPLTLGHPATVLNCQGGFLFCWCRLSVIRMKVPKLKVDNYL